MGGRGSGSGGGGTQGKGGGSSNDPDQTNGHNFDADVKADMDKIDKILNSNLSKKEKINKIKQDFGYYIDSNTRLGDLRKKAQDLVNNRHLPLIWRMR